MTERADILIRVEGSSTIGMGHLVRMHRVIRELIKRDHDVTVMTNNSSPAKSVLSDGVHILNDTDLSALENQPDVMVVDLPDKSNNTEAECMNLSLMQSFHNKCSTLIVFQELLNRTVCCDVLVNNHIYANKDSYDWVGDEPDWLLGGDYAIFDQNIRQKATSPSSWNKQPNRAVITIGGSDTQNVTPSAMQVFRDTKINVDVIIGPGVPQSQRKEIKDTTSVSGPTYNIHENPNNFAELIHRADFAVSALGLTTYELFVLHTPVIGVKTAPDQEPKARFIRQRDVGSVSTGLTTKNIREEVNTMLNEPDKRRLYTDQAAQLVDPHGIQYVVDHIERATDEQ